MEKRQHAGLVVGNHGPAPSKPAADWVMLGIGNIGISLI
jgi:hypothetical protein